ncbi:MAG: chemotaxis-specific protein-glutamate methyltransferase CheB, partial [Fibrobacteria bacterium]
MAKKIRVLIVDDSLMACKVLSDSLTSDPRIEVAGSAMSGAVALAMIPQCVPDMVMLDMDMPGMDGLQTLIELRKIRPRLPVIMCNEQTEKSGSYTVQALLNGASDYIDKPKGAAPKEGTIQAFRRELHGKIQSLFASQGASSPFSTSSPKAADPGSLQSFPSPKPGIQERVEIVAIGVSTGGPNALAELLPRLPADFPVPIVLVQHMPPNFTKSLAQSLAKRCRLQIEEGTAGQMLAPGKVWIAPGGFHMVVQKERAGTSLALNLEEPVNSCRPSVDILFESVVQAYGAKALGIVLTGMGQDGLRGAGAMRKAGASVYVQDE